MWFRFGFDLVLALGIVLVLVPGRKEEAVFVLWCNFVFVGRFKVLP